VSAAESLPSDLAAAHAMILVERAARLEAEAFAARAAAVSSGTESLIARLKLEIEKLRRELYGSRSERKVRLLEQMELQLEDLAASATEDELAAEQASRATMVKFVERRRPSRKPFPGHLPREHIVIAAPESCPCCGSTRLSKLGEDITETLEVIPRQWKVIQTVREKFSCRECEAITQPPAPFHVTPRGFAGPNLLAMVLFEKFGQHQPLNRQSERYAREGIDLSLSTLADQVGACAAALRPLHALIEDHVLKAERLHGDDTTVPILAKGKTDTGRAWVYPRRPALRRHRTAGGFVPCLARPVWRSSGTASEAVQRHPAGRCLCRLQPALSPRPEARTGDGGALLEPCAAQVLWTGRHRRQCTSGKGRAADLADCFRGVKRIDLLFDIERDINGLVAKQRLAVRAERSAPLVAKLEEWIRGERAKLSRHAPVAQAIDYMLKRWEGFIRFLADGRICLTNNAAERALRGLALGRKAWLFAGSDRGADRATVMYTLIATARLNDVDPQAWLADVLARIADTQQSRLAELLPWNWKTQSARLAA
jgi:transposase